MIYHAKREANSTAHELARAAMRDPTDSIWIEETPPCIFDIVYLELLPP
jgi:hypothetical protein